MKILWIPHTSWHIPQRAHLFCRPLSERHEVHVTDWQADFYSLKDYVSSRYIRNFTYRQYNDGKITVHGIPRISPALYTSSMRRLNSAIYSFYVKRIIDLAQINVVVSTSVVPPPKAPHLIFDLFDDNPAYWINHRNNYQFGNEIKEIEGLYISSADVIVTVSSVLADKVITILRGKRTPIEIIPNGVNVSAFDIADGDEIRRKFSLENKKVIGFISSFGEFSGLIRLVKAFELLNLPDLALLVVGDGPLAIPAQKIVQTNNIHDVFFTGKVPFSDIRSYYKAMDIGVLPFDITPFTSAACPIKLFEYLAAGLPIISTDLEEVRRMNFPNVVLVKDDPNSLADGIKFAMHLPHIRPPNLSDYDLPKLVDHWEQLLSS
jgi:glycosyltransferase involved in cell wall biosynthesis